MAATNTYQVILRGNGKDVPVNVFANSQNEAINNARNQINPSNPTSLGVVSVNSFNVCATPLGLKPSSINLGTLGGNINNY